MALLHINYLSAALQKQSGMYVILPETEPPFRVVYQLHGITDDYTIWLRRTGIERVAERYKLMIVMPDGGRSFYCDMQSGTGNYEQHILETVRYIDRTFHTDARPQSRGIGGLSMGGYGALKLGLKYPAVFGSVAAHSGVLDIVSTYRDAFWPELRAIFGDTVNLEHDLFSLVTRPGKKPALYIDCGTEDLLLPQNRRFHELLVKLRIRHSYGEFAGAHTWDYWDGRLDAALRFHLKHFGLFEG